MERQERILIYVPRDGLACGRMSFQQARLVLEDRLDQLVDQTVREIGSRDRKQWLPRYDPTSIVERTFVPTDGTKAANCGKRGLRYVAVFWAALRRATRLTVRGGYTVPGPVSLASRSHVAIRSRAAAGSPVDVPIATIVAMMPRRDSHRIVASSPSPTINGLWC
jgi:hypothetical protein